MISLKQFLSPNPETDLTQLHVVRLLVQGIGQHAAAGDGEDCVRFREKIRETCLALVDGIAPEELLVRAGSVLSDLEHHNRRTARRQELQKAELQNMVKMLTSTLAGIAATSKANVSILSDIEKHVTIASELDDVRSMKAKLSECLIDIRKEARRQQLETAETIQELRQGLDRLRENSSNAHNSSGNHPDAGPGDIVTGLPLRPEAEAAFAEASRSGSGNFAVVMVLERLQVLNARFGREAVDEMLVAFVNMVAKYLSPRDRLFRWGGPALVALISRRGSLEMVRSEVARMMETRLEHTIQTPSRSVLIPISARWSLYPMMAAPRQLFQKVDEFASRATPRG